MAPAQPPPPPLQRAWLQQAQVPGGMEGSVTAVLHGSPQATTRQRNRISVTCKIKKYGMSK